VLLGYVWFGLHYFWVYILKLLDLPLVEEVAIFHLALVVLHLLQERLLNDSVLGRQLVRVRGSYRRLLSTATRVRVQIARMLSYLALIQAPSSLRRPDLLSWMQVLMAVDPDVETHLPLLDGGGISRLELASLAGDISVDLD